MDGKKGGIIRIFGNTNVGGNLNETPFCHISHIDITILCICY